MIYAMAKGSSLKYNFGKAAYGFRYYKGNDHNSPENVWIESNRIIITIDDTLIPQLDKIFALVGRDDLVIFERSSSASIIVPFKITPNCRFEGVSIEWYLDITVQQFRPAIYIWVKYGKRTKRLIDIDSVFLTLPEAKIIAAIYMYRFEFKPGQFFKSRIHGLSREEYKIVLRYICDEYPEYMI